MCTTPEMIVQQYDTLALSDVYAVISYYLRHREEIQSYLDDREQRGDGRPETHREEPAHNLGDIRRRLLAARPA